MSGDVAEARVLFELRKHAQQYGFPADEPELVQDVARSLGVPLEIAERVAKKATGDGATEALFDPVAMRVGRFLDKPPPELRMLVKGFFPLDQAGIWAGTGGVGKSRLTLQLCASIATGCPFLGMDIEHVGPVVYLTAEDDEDELHRRIHNIGARYDQLYGGRFDRAAFRERFVVVPRVGELNFLTTMDPTGGVTETKLVDRLLRAVEQIEQLRLLIIDPIGDFHGGLINSNEHARFYARVMQRIRLEIEGGVLSTAHTTKWKNNDDDAGQDIVAGAAQWVNAHRWAATFRPMRTSDAERYDIPADERSRYVQLDVAKPNNIARPAPTWLRNEGGFFVKAHLAASEENMRSMTLRKEIVERARTLFEQHGPRSERSVQREWATQTGLLKAGRNSAMGAVHWAIAEGELARWGVKARGGWKAVIGLPEQAPKRDD